MKADLSDLREKIEWCRSNDKLCEEIASNAKSLYEKFVAREGILDYLQLTFFEIAKRFHRVPKSFEKPASSQACPIMPGSESVGRSSCCKEGLCAMCEKLKSMEDSKRAVAQVDSNDAARAQQNKRKAETEANKERMRAKARLKKGLQKV